MNRTRPGAVLICLVLLLAGCASERARLRNATDAYSTALEVLTDARQAGVINDQQAAEIEEWRSIARDALDSWRVATETGGPTDEPVQRFNQAMRALSRAVVQAERRREREDE
ncbi:MAG: hypothetical protein R6X33_18110 [Candidatus Brocadiia bacterium]